MAAVFPQKSCAACSGHPSSLHPSSLPSSSWLQPPSSKPLPHARMRLASSSWPQAAWQRTPLAASWLSLLHAAGLASTVRYWHPPGRCPRPRNPALRMEPPYAGLADVGLLVAVGLRHLLASARWRLIKALRVPTFRSNLAPATATSAASGTTSTGCLLSGPSSAASASTTACSSSLIYFSWRLPRFSGTSAGPASSRCQS